MRPADGTRPGVVSAKSLAALERSAHIIGAGREIRNVEPALIEGMAVNAAMGTGRQGASACRLPDDLSAAGSTAPAPHALPA